MPVLIGAQVGYPLKYPCCLLLFSREKGLPTYSPLKLPTLILWTLQFPFSSESLIKKSQKIFNNKLLVVLQKHSTNILSSGLQVCLGGRWCRAPSQGDSGFRFSLGLRFSLTIWFEVTRTTAVHKIWVLIPSGFPI